MIPVGPAGAFELSVRKKAAQALAMARAERIAVVRDAIVVDGRIDLLLTEVMGAMVEKHHLRMLLHQARHRRSMALVWRGAGKSTVRTVARCILALLQNPNERIVILSKTGTAARDMLLEVKRNIESDVFKAHFGDIRGDIWNDDRITVKGYTTAEREVGVTAVGADGSIVSRHWTMAFIDDLVDEENARTAHMREKIKNFYWKSFIPTMLKDSCIWWSGTRYHNEDLYSEMIAGEYKDRYLRIPVTEIGPDGIERSNWEEKFPVEDMRALRRNMGDALYETQYECKTDLLVGGGLFKYDAINRKSMAQLAEEGVVLEDLPIYAGFDLAVSEKEKDDSSAIVVVARDAKTDHCYVLACFNLRLGLDELEEWVQKIDEEFMPAQIMMEAVAFQNSLVLNVKRKHRQINVVGLKTHKDKFTRMMRLQPIVNGGRLTVVRDYPCSLQQRNSEGTLLISQLVNFPNDKHDDLCDALDFALKGTGAARMVAPVSRFDESPVFGG